jgi:hypothetical protein
MPWHLGGIREEEEAIDIRDQAVVEADPLGIAALGSL